MMISKYDVSSARYLWIKGVIVKIFPTGKGPYREEPIV
jgi:hypothetical protein